MHAHSSHPCGRGAGLARTGLCAGRGRDAAAAATPQAHGAGIAQLWGATPARSRSAHGEPAGGSEDRDTPRQRRGAPRRERAHRAQQRAALQHDHKVGQAAAQQGGAGRSLRVELVEARRKAPHSRERRRAGCRLQPDARRRHVRGGVHGRVHRGQAQGQEGRGEARQGRDAGPAGPCQVCQEGALEADGGAR